MDEQCENLRGEIDCSESHRNDYWIEHNNDQPEITPSTTSAAEVTHVLLKGKYISNEVVSWFF